jgi:hypothetical protein
MNTEIKVLLTINLEGGALTQGKPETYRYSLTKKDLFPKQSFKGNDGDKIIRSGKYTHTPLIPKEAKQKINLCKEAYDYMTSIACPQWFHKLKEWKKMSPKERLEQHLARICNQLNGKSFTYQIVED